MVLSNDTLNRDDSLTYSGAGGVPQVVGAAYTNNDTNPATGTTLYVLDALTNSLFVQTPPNDGVLDSASAVALGTDIPSTNVGFDIPLFGTNNGYVSFNDTFYSLMVGTGPLVAIGQIGGAGEEITDIAIVPEPTTSLLLLGGLGALLTARRRRV